MSAWRTLASRMWSSASANRLPIHVRRPNPKGSDTKGWILLPAVRGHWSDLSHRSGRNRSGAGKFSSMLLTTRWGNMMCVCGQSHDAFRINHFLHFKMNFAVYRIAIFLRLVSCKAVISLGSTIPIRFSWFSTVFEYKSWNIFLKYATTFSTNIVSN